MPSAGDALNTTRRISAAATLRRRHARRKRPWACWGLRTPILCFQVAPHPLPPLGVGRVGEARDSDEPGWGAKVSPLPLTPSPPRAARVGGRGKQTRSGKARRAAYGNGRISITPL